MAKLKRVCFSFSLMLLLNLGVGSLKREEKWVNNDGFRHGYNGGFCLPGICFGGGGGLNLGGGGGLNFGGGLNLGSGGGGGLNLGDGGLGLNLGGGGGLNLGGSGLHLGIGGSGAHLTADGGVSRAAYLGGGGGPDYFGPAGNIGSACDWNGPKGNICSGGPIPGAEVRETMYCTPVPCTTNECSGFHVHMDKKLYNSLVSKNVVPKEEGQHSKSVHHMPETVKQNESVVSEGGDVQEIKEAAMAPESN